MTLPPDGASTLPNGGLHPDHYGAELVGWGRKGTLWFDDWEVCASDSIVGKVNEALTSVDAVILVWSANASRSDWGAGRAGDGDRTGDR